MASLFPTVSGGAVYRALLENVAIRLDLVGENGEKWGVLGKWSYSRHENDEPSQAALCRVVPA